MTKHHRSGAAFCEDCTKLKNIEEGIEVTLPEDNTDVEGDKYPEDE